MFDDLDGKVLTDIICNGVTKGIKEIVVLTNGSYKESDYGVLINKDIHNKMEEWYRDMKLIDNIKTVMGIKIYLTKYNIDSLFYLMPRYYILENEENLGILKGENKWK